MKKLIVVGGGGFAKEVIWLAQDCGYEVIGVLDDNEAMHNKEILGIKVLGSVIDWVNFNDCQFIIALGSPRVRHLIYKKMLTLGEPSFATLVHPNVVASSYVNIGEGSIICAGCTLTVEIDIGKHSILNLSCTIGHETQIGDFVTLAPIAAISGNVTLENFTEVGTSATIRQGLTIGKGGMLGMGGVQTKSIPENSIFAGNPAKLLKEIPAVDE